MSLVAQQPLEALIDRKSFLPLGAIWQTQTVDGADCLRLRSGGEWFPDHPGDELPA